MNEIFNLEQFNLEQSYLCASLSRMLLCQERFLDRGVHRAVASDHKLG